jgi:uncharacterized protein with NRDE domain
MCLIALAWNAHPQWPLVLAANRDEFHARPTAPLGAWPEDSSEGSVIGGRDLREGGGWLALSATGRLAAVTNVRVPGLATGARSRGALVRGFVTGGESVEGYARRQDAEGTQYGPYNLFVWDGASLAYAGNRPHPHWQSLPPGLHAASNGALGEPWPKLSLLSQRLRAWVAALDDQEPDIAPMLATLAEDRPSPDAELPDTGVGLEIERMLSPPFIRSEGYGTRASSVVLVNRDGRARFFERRFGSNGIHQGDTRLELQLRPQLTGARA